MFPIAVFSACSSSWWSTRHLTCSAIGCWAWSTLRMLTPSSRLRDTCEYQTGPSGAMKYELCLLFGVVSFVSEIKISVSLVNCCENRLDRFEKTNEMLINFNGLSNVRLQQMNERFLLHTRTLVEMKKDLDSIFRRIRLVSTTPTMQKQKIHL